ncbi:MAG TPA: rhomboid family intramembrane serine protease, partial [Burkholderiaceae bacterium]|nr:rhomboid family intramembrane serine protease [Burkholderiaceae bacterium]
ALAAHEPWRAVSAIGVHYSAQHLAANLAGAAVVAGFGAVAALPARCAGAWLAAWPLTQFGLLARPDLAHYGGLSGVLHAGVAIAALFLIARGTRAQRGLGAAVLAGVGLKLVAEAPWGAALRAVPGWDIAVAPFAHVSGVVAGALCALVVLAWPRAGVPGPRSAPR